MEQEVTFFFLFFSTFYFKTTEICFGSAKMKLYTEKKCFTQGKKSGKVTLPSPEKYSCYTTGTVVCISPLMCIHTLRVYYAHAAANLNSGYSKYAKVARVHYFCTIALRISRAVLTQACASRRADLRERKVDSFSERVIIFCL